MPGNDGQYQRFLNHFPVENHRPSLQKTRNIIVFWYMLQKIDHKNKEQITIDGRSFSCCADLQDTQLADMLVREVKMNCNEPIKKLHYAANFHDICMYSA